MQQPGTIISNIKKKTQKISESKKKTKTGKTFSLLSSYQKLKCFHENVEGWVSVAAFTPTLYLL